MIGCSVDAPPTRSVEGPSETPPGLNRWRLPETSTARSQRSAGRCARSGWDWQTRPPRLQLIHCNLDCGASVSRARFFAKALPAARYPWGACRLLVKVGSLSTVKELGAQARGRLDIANLVLHGVLEASRNGGRGRKPSEPVKVCPRVSEVSAALTFSRRTGATGGGDAAPSDGG